MSSIIQLLTIIQKYVGYSSYIILVIGIIGNLMNILIFTKLKIFQNNPLNFYLIIESIADIIILITSLTLQPISPNSGFQLIDTSIFWCKIRAPLVQSIRLLISSIICLEAFEQYLSTHPRISIRQLSTSRRAKFLVCTFYILWLLHSTPYVIFSNIVPNYGCIITNQILIHYYSYGYYIFLNGLLPMFISSIFSILAYRNVRRIVQLRLPIERRRLDRQMTAMIFARVITFLIFITPYTVYRIYAQDRQISLDDILNYSINQLIIGLVTDLLLCIFSLNFYIFLITSHQYRRQTKNIIKKYFRSLNKNLQINPNDIHPHSESSANFALSNY